MGESDLYLSSADWMSRNLHRRIEVAFPILDPNIKQEIVDILKIQLADNTSAVWINEKLENLFKTNQEKTIRAQRDTYEYLKQIKQ